MVNKIVSSARSKLWMMYRLRDAGANQKQLLETYINRIRSKIEYSAQVYGCIINKSQCKSIEDIQVHATQIILGFRSQSYAKNLKLLGIESLAARRSELMKSFAIKAYRSYQHRWWFVPSPSPLIPTRVKQPRFRIPRAHSSFKSHSPFTVYSKILNSLTDKEWSDLYLHTPSLENRQNRQIIEQSSNYNEVVDHSCNSVTICSSPRSVHASPTIEQPDADSCVPCQISEWLGRSPRSDLCFFSSSRVYKSTSMSNISSSLSYTNRLRSNSV